MGKTVFVNSTSMHRWKLVDDVMTDKFNTISQTMVRKAFNSLANIFNGQGSTICEIATGYKGQHGNTKRDVRYYPNENRMAVGCQVFDAANLQLIKNWAFASTPLAAKKAKSRKR